MSDKGNPDAPQLPPEFINVADLADPHDSHGRTYRQVNAEKTHTIPVGALVEIVGSDGFRMNGARLFVVRQGRDCDQTPMYWLSADPEDLPSPEDDRDFWTKAKHKWYGGFDDESLMLVALPEETV
jgi:hypothetical protein